MKKISLSLLFLSWIGYSYGQADEPIPFTTFSEIIINLSFPEYRNLKSDGGFVEIDGGVRGILVYRIDETTYLAYERNCPYRPSEACAQVDVDISRIFLIDRCCGSHFSLAEGNPTSGPNSRPLRRYRTMFAGSTLTITDEIVN